MEKGNRRIALTHSWLKILQEYSMKTGWNVSEGNIYRAPDASDIVENAMGIIIGQLRLGYKHYGGKYNFGTWATEKNQYPLLALMVPREKRYVVNTTGKVSKVKRPEISHRKILLAASESATWKKINIFGKEDIDITIEYPSFISESDVKKIINFFLVSDKKE